MTTQVCYEAVLEYEDEEMVPEDPERVIRRLVMEEPEFGRTTVEEVDEDD